MTTASDLLHKYTDPVTGAIDVGRALSQGLGTQIGSGIAGLGSAVRHLSMDKGADAVAKFQSDHAPDALSPAGIKTIQSIAPAFYGVANSKLGQMASDLGSKYNDAVNTMAGVGSIISPEVGAGIYAAGTAAPNAMLPEGGEAEAAGNALDRVISKNAVSGIKDTAPAVSMPHTALDFSPVLEDGATRMTLAREQAANARRAEDGLSTTDVPLSEFAGRQAEHEGAVAQRMNDKTPRQISAVPGYASHLTGSVPDDATVYSSHHPETGALQGAAVTVPRNGGHQITSIDVSPDFQRQGIGKDLFNKAVQGAHDEGLDFHGDTSVTPEQIANVYHSGHTVEMNPNVLEDTDVSGKPVLRSSNGQPVYKIPSPSAAEDADPDDAMPGSWVRSQAYADGGEAGVVAGGLSDLIHQYAPLKGMPLKATVPGAGALDVAPNQAARAAAAAYAKESGIKNTAPSTYARVDPAKAQAIAQAFDAMPHNPDDPATKASYQALIDETKAQYQHMKKAGVNVEFMPPSQYGSSAPKGTSPSVDWSKPDLLDDSAVTPESIKNTYAGRSGMRGGDPKVYQSYLPIDELSAVSGSLNGAPKIAPPISTPGVYPPIKVAVTDKGLSIIDGEHRTQEWNAQGHTDAPAWVLDYRKNIDPYAKSPRLMAEDVAKNNHMYVYPTAAGFGGPEAAGLSDNPLLGDSGESFGGVPATHNDLFRAVHDYFGHAKEGVGFRANGEENAWRQHAGMYSDAARPAMTTETRGQNSYVNFGPNGLKNQLASSADTQYAPQKIGLLPPEMSQPDDPEMHFLHMSNLDTPDATLDPKFYGRGMKGAEAKRGGTKVISLYPSDIDPKDVEGPLQGKTPYRVSVPASKMYDMSSDPEGYRSSAPSYSDAEDAVKDAGYAGYHVPDGQGILQGQGRLFGPTPASRLGPGRDPVVDEDLASGFADGGEVGPVVGGLSDLIKQYAPEAEALAKQVGEKGTATYNPGTGDLHQSGYIIPNHSTRSVALDAAPDAGQIHDFLMQHQDAFDEDPSAVLHVHSDDAGNHFMHAAHYTPDFADAADKTATLGLPGYQDIGTSEIHSAAPTADPSAPEGMLASAHDPQDSQDYLASPAPRTSWAAGQQTVANPKRNAFPEIYGDPRTTIANASQKVAPEDPLMQRLFGVSRRDLSDQALSRQGNELGVLPGAKANPTGSSAAADVMTPQNAQRLVDVLGEARKSPGLYQGMTGWYNMDPLYARFVQLYGEDAAPAKYKQFNALSGMASPGSDVGTEIARGTAANWLQSEGRFSDFIKHGGGVESGPSGGRPADMAELPGHVYHRTAQAVPMQQYLDSGQIQMKSPKVPMYIQASGVPETGFQTDTPVGDAHWARGVGLADTRGTRTSKGAEITPGSSVSTPEMQQLAPWWRDKVAGQVGLESVPAQALAWGAMSHITGVKSAIGAPKLEILSSQIGKLANRLGISPESARDLVITGKAGAFSHGGAV